MQQTEQSRAMQSQPARKEEKTAHRQFDRTGAPQTLLLALQAVQAGVPLTRLPASMLLALSAQLGNSALLDLMAQQGRGPETITSLPPPRAVETRPMDITTAPVPVVSPPDWAAMPAAQTAPASPAGLAMQGGVSLAGG